MSQELKRTPLYHCHHELGARFTGFGGWEMPVQYSGLVDEHLTVRNHVGLFDVSHMGELMVTGPNALKALQYWTSNDVAKLVPGKAQYSLLLNPSGGVVDDIIVYQLAQDEYLLCVNAANTDKDFSWLQRNNIHHAELEDHSSKWAQIAVQGPKAAKLLSLLFPGRAVDLASFPAFTVNQWQIGGKLNLPVLVARTGYTGEDGFEIFCPATAGASLWKELLLLGEPLGVKPAGLGARDTLRLEACFPLHGHELRDDLSALSSGLGWVIKFNKGDFLGREALFKQQNLGLKQKLVGLLVCEPGIIREGTKIFDLEEKVIGSVSSGTKPPTLNKAIGLGFVPVGFSEVGTKLRCEVRGRKLQVEVIKLPFYKRNEQG